MIQRKILTTRTHLTFTAFQNINKNRDSILQFIMSSPPCVPDIALSHTKQTALRIFIREKVLQFSSRKIKEQLSDRWDAAFRGDDSTLLYGTRLKT